MLHACCFFIPQTNSIKLIFVLFLKKDFWPVAPVVQYFFQQPQERQNEGDSNGHRKFNSINRRESIYFFVSSHPQNILFEFHYSVSSQKNRGLIFCLGFFSLSLLFQVFHNFCDMINGETIFFKHLAAGAEAPNLSIPITAPSSPTYLYQD